METDWTKFVDGAPENWRQDGYLADHIPIAVTSRFGQDQPICKKDTRVQEAQTWYNERCYHMIRYVTVGLATHVR
jgi:hypothetical protein